MATEYDVKLFQTTSSEFLLTPDIDVSVWASSFEGAVGVAMREYGVPYASSAKVNLAGNRRMTTTFVCCRWSSETGLSCSRR
jgi:hypothetical protein